MNEADNLLINFVQIHPKYWNKIWNLDIMIKNIVSQGETYHFESIWNRKLMRLKSSWYLQGETYHFESIWNRKLKCA